jgi:hypothetical protein
MNLLSAYSPVMLNPQPLPPRDLVIRWYPPNVLGSRGIIIVGG